MPPNNSSTVAPGTPVALGTAPVSAHLVIIKLQ